MTTRILTPPSAPQGQPPAGGGPVMPTSSPTGKGLDIVEIKQYFHVIVKRIWLVALCFVIALAVTVVKLVRQVPVYRSSTYLLLSKGLPMMPKQIQQEQVEILGDYMETQVKIIQSNLIISQARERMNRPADEIAEKLVRIIVEKGYMSAFIYIRVESLDPNFAADFANAMADEYLDLKAQERMDASQSTVASLSQQVTRLREELKRSEDRLLSFEKENSVVALKERGNIAARFLAQLSEQAADYKSRRMVLEAQRPLFTDASDEIVLSALTLGSSARLAGIAQQPIAAMGSTPDGANKADSSVGSMLDYNLLPSTDWQGLQKQKAILQGQLADLREKFRENHPAIQKAIADLKVLDKNIALELQFALKQYYDNLEALSIKEQAAKKAEIDWEDDALSLSRKLREYDNLQSDLSRLNSLYNVLFNRLQEVDVSIGIEPEWVKVMERAAPPTNPVTPRKLQSIFLAALIGLGVGLGLVFALEYIDDSIRYPEEVTKVLNLPFLGVIPAANWDPDDLRTHVLANIDQKSGITEAYRNVRSAMLYAADKNNVRVIGFTSAVPKEGKTTTCLNMAVSLAQAGLRVLLVDADMRRGELHKFFGLEGGRGLADVLAGQTKPEAVIQRTGIPNLDLVATGPFPSNPAELVLRGEFKAFLDYARRSYDRVLLDCPPVMAVSESSTLAAIADGTVMIVWAGQTSRKLSQLALNIILQRGANVLGCVLNNLEFGRVGYYYYSTYYGYYDYNYRYERAAEPTRR